jgi:hypothetical protein
MNVQLHTTPDAPSQHNCVHGDPAQQLRQPATRMFQARAGTLLHWGSNVALQEVQE